MRMSKTKQNKQASVKTPKMELNSVACSLLNERCDQIQEAMSGNVRLRPTRWHGATSLYDIHRINGFMADASSGSMSMSKFRTLAKEIPSFFAVLGPNLTRLIKAQIAASK